MKLGNNYKYKFFIIILVIIIGSLIYYIKKEKNTINNNFETLYSYYDSGKWGYINSSGEVVIDAIYDEASYILNESTLVEKDNREIFIDSEGNNILEIPQEYKVNSLFFKDLSNGVFAVENSEGKYALMNNVGDIITDFIFDSIYSFHDGFASCKINNKCGLIDASGKIVIPAEYDSLGVYNDGIVSVKLNNKWGYINLKNEIIIPIDFKYAYDFNNEIGIVSDFYNEDYYYAFDKDGNKLFEFDCKPISNFQEELCKVKIKNEGFVNKSGELVIDTKYIQAYDFSDGLSAVCNLDFKWGFVDYEGNYVIEPKYSKVINSFYNGIALVEYNNERIYINKDGEEIFKYSYDLE